MVRKYTEAVLFFVFEEYWLQPMVQNIFLKAKVQGTGSDQPDFIEKL